MGLFGGYPKSSFSNPALTAREARGMVSENSGTEKQRKLFIKQKTKAAQEAKALKQRRQREEEANAKKAQKMRAEQRARYEKMLKDQKRDALKNGKRWR